MRAATERGPAPAADARGPALRLALALPWLAIAAPAAWQLVLLATAIAGRLTYPLDLEWMEGGLLHHALRISNGEGIYVPPSVDFIPYLYTPFFPAMLALFAIPFGLSYAVGRAFSLVGLLGIVGVTIATLGAPIHQHARRAPVIAAIVLALGLFAAGYPYVEGWYDLVRADTFFLFMVTGGVAGLTRWARSGAGLRGHARVAAGSVLLALAFFCKQTGIIYVALGGLVVLVVNWRRVPAYVLGAGVVGLGGCALLQVRTDGWFWIYVREIHAAHDFNPDRFWKSFENILWWIPAQSIVIAAALVVVLATWALRRQLPRQTWSFLLWTATYAVSTLIGAIGWGTEFAHFNAYMPALLHGALAAAAGVLAVFACARLLVAGRAGEIVATVLALAAAAPLAHACYAKRWSPARFVPTAKDAAAGAKLLARLRALPGDVWMPSHPWYLHLAGKRPYVHRMGVKDVTWRQPRKVAGLEEALRARAFEAIVVDNRDVHLELPVLTANYRLRERLPPDERPRVYTGAPVVPDAIWTPAVPARPPAGVRAAFAFEEPGWGAWTTTGAAWGGRPVGEPLPGQPAVPGATGQRYASSMHGGDASTGRLSSPPFALGRQVTLHLGGGTDASKLRVELWIGDRIVATASVPAPGGDALREITLDTRAHVGPYQGRLVLVDDSPTGHLVVDDVWVE